MKARTPANIRKRIALSALALAFGALTGCAQLGLPAGTSGALAISTRYGSVEYRTPEGFGK